MPVPPNVMLPPPGLSSPFPAQIVPVGPIAIAPIDCEASPGHAAWSVAPPSLAFHTPPVAAVTYTVSPAATARSVRRPPMLVGPSSAQAPLSCKPHPTVRA
jgi:hypothetical protein